MRHPVRSGIPVRPLIEESELNIVERNNLPSDQHFRRDPAWEKNCEVALPVSRNEKVVRIAPESSGQRVRDGLLRSLTQICRLHNIRKESVSS